MNNTFHHSVCTLLLLVLLYSLFTFSGCAAQTSTTFDISSTVSIEDIAHTSSQYINITESSESIIHSQQTTTSTNGEISTEASTESKLAQLYLELIEQYQKKYGVCCLLCYPDWLAFQFPVGLSYADLIDFDGDGTDELLLVYGIPEHSNHTNAYGFSVDCIDRKYYFDIWGFLDNSLLKLYSGPANSGESKEYWAVDLHELDNANKLVSWDPIIQPGVDRIELYQLLDAPRWGSDLSNLNNPFAEQVLDVQNYLLEKLGLPHLSLIDAQTKIYSNAAFQTVIGNAMRASPMVEEYCHGMLLDSDNDGNEELFLLYEKIPNGSLCGAAYKLQDKALLPIIPETPVALVAAAGPSGSIGVLQSNGRTFYAVCGGTSDIPEIDHNWYLYDTNEIGRLIEELHCEPTDMIGDFDKPDTLIVIRAASRNGEEISPEEFDLWESSLDTSLMGGSKRFAPSSSVNLISLYELILICSGIPIDIIP